MKIAILIIGIVFVVFFILLGLALCKAAGAASRQEERYRNEP